MLKHIFTCIFLFFFIQTYTQVYIDFEDDSLRQWEESTPGHWETSSINSISQNFSLHHCFDNPSSGNDQVALPIGNLDLTQSITWKFKIKHGYTPSSSNNWAVFLFSDGGANQMTPSNYCNAYVLGVNFMGSDDFLKLWKKSNNNNEEIINTDFNWQDSVSIGDYIDFEVNFSPPENWSIKLSVNNNTAKTSRFEFRLSPHIKLAQYFGIYYEYSSSQDQKLWFDDLEIIGNFFVDTVPPYILSLSIQQDFIDLTFSEPIKNNSIIEKSISISPEVIFNIVSKSSTQLSLELEIPLEVDKDYLLHLKNISDLSDNVIVDTTLTIQYSIARQNDIVITEIMTDPIPAVTLPEQEFIEIFNRSTKTFNLSNFSIWIGDKQQIIHSGNILPGEYIIICDDSDIEIFSDFGKVVYVNSLPNLTKSTGSIILRNNLGQMIHQIEYTDDIFVSEIKQQGGWTLEMIDPDNPCHFKDNWQESKDESGGTPGRQNSVFADNKDLSPPKIKNISVVDDTSIKITFNEAVDSLYTSKNITFNQDEIKNYRILDFQNIEANLTEPVVPRKLYDLSLSGVRDCATNEIDNTIYYPFAKTERPDSLDIVFNEIMFDPMPGLSEYVEIINSSDKFLDLSVLKLAKQNSTYDFDFFTITETSSLIVPEQLAVLTKNCEPIADNFSINQDAIYLEMEKFPALTNTSGILALFDTLGNIIDIFEYNESMHFNLLQETKGVALEKINTESSSLDRTNWHSASASENYATPGWPNSQMFNTNNASHSTFIIEPEVFSPNYDGYNDELHIKYNFNESGTVVNIRVFDAKGRLINQLANNFLCGTQGEFIWQGKNFDDDFALNGIYLIYIEYFDMNGNVNSHKESCVLAR